jgi:hypothetical protein
VSLHNWCQLYLLITSALAIWCVARTDKWHRWGFIFGLISEPGWVYAAITADQWGVTILAAFWTFSWAVGAYRRFHKAEPKRHDAPWLCTASGKQYWPTCPRPSDVDINDIARHLSMLCRWTGACREFYSVAEHSVYVSRLVPKEHALTALLHDSPEYVINDINRPTKVSLPDYRELEDLQWREAIAPAFGLPLEMPECVHVADRLVGRAEQLQIMPTMPGICNSYRGSKEGANITIHCFPPRLAERLFLERYREILRDQANEQLPDEDEFDREFEAIAPSPAPDWANPRWTHPANAHQHVSEGL